MQSNSHKIKMRNDRETKHAKKVYVIKINWASFLICLFIIYIQYIIEDAIVNHYIYIYLFV